MLLKQSDINDYTNNGYLKSPGNLFDAETFARLQADFEAALDTWCTIYGQAAEEMDKPHWYFPELFDYLCHEEVLNMVEQIIGPDIVLFTSHFICKPAQHGRRVPWHEDSGYWENILQPMGDPLTIWLALDPSRRENGCLRVIPESHRNPDLAYTAVPDPEASVFPEEITANQFNEQSAVDIELEPGQFSIHHASVIHGSNPNTSNYRRCGFTMRYFSAHSKFNTDIVDEDFHIYLVRGKDHAGNSYSPSHQRNQRNHAAVNTLRHKITNCNKQITI